MSHNESKNLRQNILKFEFYVISLWLLFLLIIVVKIDIPICLGDDCVFIGVERLVRRNFLPLLSLFFIFSGWVSYLRFKYRIKASRDLPVEVAQVEDLNYEHLTFLTTYIVPLICFNLDNARYVISLFVLLFVIGLIYIKTDKFYANPTLAILGFRLYKIDTAQGQKILITKDRITSGDKISFTRLDEKIVYGRKL